MHRLIERWFGPAVLSAFVILLLASFTFRLQHGEQLHGAGATFPAPLYARWIALFERENPEVKIRYDGVGSGAGIRAISAKEVHFGASDAMMNHEVAANLPGELLQIPMALGPVVMAYNLPDVDDRITLDSELIAGIYLGEIERWDDPRLQGLNPGIEMPDDTIFVAHRADSSGTTAIFTDYLSAVSSRWKNEVGHGKKVEWPVSSGAGEGNDGVAHQIFLKPGGIGYLEMKYAENAGLHYAAIINRDGHKVLPSVKSVQAAEQNTPVIPGQITKTSIVNAPGATSYPIAGFTYILAYRKPGHIHSPELREALVDYLTWALTEGQRFTAELNYTPLPLYLQEKALALVKSIEVYSH